MVEEMSEPDSDVTVFKLSVRRADVNVDSAKYTCEVMDDVEETVTSSSPVNIQVIRKSPYPILLLTISFQVRSHMCFFISFWMNFGTLHK